MLKHRSQDLLVIVSVIKYPLKHPPRVVANVKLEDGTSYDLTEDQWGKRNYELTLFADGQGDTLYCVKPLPGKKIILVGTQEGAKRLS